MLHLKSKSYKNMTNCILLFHFPQLNVEKSTFQRTYASQVFIENSFYFVSLIFDKHMHI